MFMTSEDIYTQYGDKTVPFDNTHLSHYCGKKDIARLLNTNSMNVNTFMYYINHEDEYHIVKYKFETYARTQEYEKYKDVVLKLIKDYFYKYKDDIFKQSQKYQKERFKKHFSREKLEYCITTTNSKDSKRNIFVPSNFYYYLYVLNYIINYYLSNKNKEECIEVPFTSNIKWS